MTLLISKLITQLIYPTGIFAVLFLIALIQLLFKRLRLAFICLFIGSTLLTASATPKLAKVLASSLERQYPAQSIQSLPVAEVAVVLGGLLNAPLHPRQEIELTGTSDRLHHAFRIWKAGKAKRIYITGGNVYDGFRAESESEYARRLLIEWGVTPESIAIGESAKSTQDNAAEAVTYFRKEGINSGNLFLITSALHMPRSVELFRASDLNSQEFNGLKLIPVSTDTLVTLADRPRIFDWIPSAAALSLTTRAWHEKVGLWYFQIRQKAGV